MRKIQFGILFLCFIFVLGASNIATAGSGTVVEINEQNFPDAKFRKLVKENTLLNKDYNDTLTSDEIDAAVMLEILTEDTLEPGDWDVTGVEKLTNLKSVELHLQGVQKGKKITGRDVKGTFRNNKKLTQFILDMDGREITQQEIEQLVSLPRLRELCIENADIQKLSLSKAAKLETLTIKNCQNLTKLDVKGAKALKKITVENTSVKSLDLTRNPKLKEVAVQFGYSCVRTNLKTGEMSKTPFFQWGKKKCKVKFAKKNRIQKLCYFTADKQVDISDCTKLKEIHVSARTALKMPNSWYQKNKKKLTVYAQGFRQKNLKTKKSGSAVLLKATKTKDVKMGYYCEELDKEGDS